jgi:hypothetical protein
MLVLRKQIKRKSKQSSFKSVQLAMKPDSTEIVLLVVNDNVA